MAITATLVDATPYTLRYLLTDDAGGWQGDGPPPPAFPLFLSSATLIADSRPGLLRDLLQAGTLGYPPRAINPLVNPNDVLTADAQAYGNSSDADRDILTNALMPRARVKITPRENVDVQWAVFVTAGGAPRNMQMTVATNVSRVASAYLDIDVRHSYDL